MRECPLILVLPGHQMFLMSWLSCHFKMRRKKSNKILKTVFFTLLVITSSVVKNKANKISGFASIITIKEYEWFNGPTYSSTGSGTPYLTTANHVYQSHVTHQPV